MIKYGSEDKMFTIPRWIHQMSIDIHTLNKPVFELTDEQKTSISNAEIIAATEDATYGHDFKAIEGITYLGEVFMNEVLVHVDPNYTPFNYHRNKANMPVVSFEKKCIVDVLQRNEYVTITKSGSIRCHF